MKKLNYLQVENYKEASEQILNSSENVSVISGGVDFIGNWKDQILPEYPDTIVKASSSQENDGIHKTDEGWSIGAQTTLNEFVNQSEIPVLADAAGSIASEQIRNTATIAGNLFQDVRCQYYHYTDFMGGCMTCNRKGGELCCAMHAESPRHSLFGGMETHLSPCREECPLGTNIPAYTEEIRKGNIRRAAEILMEENPFPMLLSRICPHPCETKCNQAKFGDGVSIHNLERFVGDYILRHRDEFYQKPARESGQKIAIVGAGPSGLSAAFYLRKAGHAVTVYDRNERAGGVLQYGIPHYRLPKQYLKQVLDSLEDMGIVFRMNTEVGKDVTVENLLSENDRVYLSTGAWKQPVLGIGHEEVAEFGLNFLNGVTRFVRKNLDGEILVCGGGNVAMDAALTAVRLGAKKVTLICLEQEKEMPASPEEIARCREEGVEIHCGWGLKEVVVDSDGKPLGMQSMKCLSVYDENHRFSPKYSDTELRLFEADAIILATGQRVDVSYLGENLAEKILTPRGLIGVDLLSGKTADPRIYAGGDAASGPNIASRAVAGGKKAALAICEELAASAGVTEMKAETKGVFKTIDPQGIALTQACREAQKPVRKRSLYEEDSQTPEYEEIQREAGRCLNCSCFAVTSSDLAPVLYLMDAEFVTTKRTLTAKELLASEKAALDVLEKGELLTQIHIPEPKFEKLCYERAQTVPGPDFSHVSLTAGITLEDGKVKDCRFVFGGVAGIPYEAREAAEYLRGKTFDFETVEKAASLAVKDACTFPESQEQLWEMKRLLRKACGERG
ncbi:MAG: FAD-dependent oxidoreductase [Lachnospiraceae bacterium]|nr:FAD-dependent oxidoreductase [Lachnospiraceae bacterium]